MLTLNWLTCSALSSILSLAREPWPCAGAILQQYLCSITEGRLLLAQTKRIRESYRTGHGHVNVDPLWDCRVHRVNPVPPSHIHSCAPTPTVTPAFQPLQLTYTQRRVLWLCETFPWRQAFFGLFLPKGWSFSLDNRNSTLLWSRKFSEEIRIKFSSKKRKNYFIRILIFWFRRALQYVALDDVTDMYIRHLILTKEFLDCRMLEKL
jgi:hypothetical protein